MQSSQALNWQAVANNKKEIPQMKRERKLKVFKLTLNTILSTHLNREAAFIYI